MKISAKPKFLQYAVPGAGLLGALLRFFLYTTAVDEKGLLVTGHWANILLWLLTALVLAVLILCCRSIDGPQKYKHCYPASAISAAGCILCAVGFLLTGLTDLTQAFGVREMALPVLCLFSAGALVYIGFCRLTRRKPLFLCHALVCVCFALRMVSRYRAWSSEPQLQNYFFYMAAHVGLMLVSYHLAAFDADMGHHRPLWFLGLFTAFACFVCLCGNGDSLFMLFCGLWVITNLTELAIPRRRVRPRLQLEEQSPEEA